MLARSLVFSAGAPNHGAVCPSRLWDNQDGRGELVRPGAAPLPVAVPHRVGGPDAVIVESTPVVLYFRVPVLTINHNIGHCLLPLYFPCYTLLFSTC